jgi:hypothetical protein
MPKLKITVEHVEKKEILDIVTIEVTEECQELYIESRDAADNPTGQSATLFLGEYVEG